MPYSMQQLAERWTQEQRELAGELVANHTYLMSFRLATEILAESRSRFGIPAKQSGWTLRTIAETIADPVGILTSLENVAEEDQARYIELILWLQRLGKIPLGLSFRQPFKNCDHDRIRLHPWMAVNGWEMSSLEMGEVNETYESVGLRLLAKSLETGGILNLEPEEQVILFEAFGVLLFSGIDRRDSDCFRDLLGSALRKTEDLFGPLDPNLFALLLFGFRETKVQFLKSYETLLDLSDCPSGSQVVYFPSCVLISKLYPERAMRKLRRNFPAETLEVFFALADFELPAAERSYPARLVHRA